MSEVLRYSKDVPKHAFTTATLELIGEGGRIRFIWSDGQTGRHRRVRRRIRAVGGFIDNDANSQAEETKRGDKTSSETNIALFSIKTHRNVLRIR